jgi:hypothetical protein
MKIKFLLSLIALWYGGHLIAQTHKCATADLWQQKVQRDPAALERKQQSELATQQWIAIHSNADETQAIIDIPVVVHVVYNTQTQNISTTQIQSQIAVLNEDFRLLNGDSVPIGHPFWPNTADSQIEFCLATVDPNGDPTSGITRTNTSVVEFGGNGLDDVKFTSAGGRDGWDPTQYLNIWVCELEGGLLGFATFPSELSTDPDYDGVVIDYEAFGTTGTAQSPTDLGRTGTHEIGHWLNLYHIWGDEACGDDLVSDTKVAEQENYGCPLFPHNSFNACGTDANGEMYMNYMDYVDDGCMNMFTFGQKNRMRAAINTHRSGLLSSGGCGAVAAASDVLTPGMLQLAPNPSTGSFTLYARNFIPRNTSIVVTNALGVEVQRATEVGAFPHTIDLGDLPNDIYFVRVTNGKSLITQKVVIQH